MVRVRFSSEICKFRMCNFEIVQSILQLAQIDKLHAIYTVGNNGDKSLRAFTMCAVIYCCKYSFFVMLVFLFTFKYAVSMHRIMISFLTCRHWVGCGR